MDCGMQAPARLHLTRNESTSSDEFWTMMKWVCMCMHRPGSDDASCVRTRELCSLVMSLQQSPESQPKRGKYTMMMPSMVRMAMYDDNDKDLDGQPIPDLVLRFKRTSGVSMRMGLYTCRLRLELSNASWRLGFSDFIEGRGPCTVSAYLFDCRFIQPLPRAVGFMDSYGLLDSIKSAFQSMCAVTIESMPRHLQEEGLVSEHGVQAP